MASVRRTLDESRRYRYSPGMLGVSKVPHGQRVSRCQILLRPITDGDVGILREIYASSRDSELAQIPWPKQVREAFIDQQFQLQHDQYAKNYPNPEFDLIVVDGEVAGRLYVSELESEIRVVDIAVLGPFRNRGIGGLLLAELKERAARQGKALSIHVETNNPARRLYARLGFLQGINRGPYDYFAIPAPASAQPSLNPA